MEDFSKMPKAELVEKLKEYKHLGQAITAKDRDIVQLKKELSELKNTIKTMVSREDHKAILKTFEDKLKQFDGAVKKQDIEKFIKKAEEDVQRAKLIAMRYAQAYKDLMKVLKVNLDIAISADELLSEKFKGE